MEAADVKDDDPVWFIDISPAFLQRGVGCVAVCRDDKMGVYITQSKGVPR